MFLIVVTDGFSKFENAAQLCSYIGITPTTRESGSRVRGRARISKVGNRKLRNLLFLCSFNACKHDKARKAVYDRIVNKGKSKKLALIAVRTNYSNSLMPLQNQEGHTMKLTFQYCQDKKRIDPKKKLEESDF